MTNKGKGKNNELLIEHNCSLVTEPSEVANHMNEFYVNIAQNICANVERPDLSELVPDEAVSSTGITLVYVYSLLLRGVRSLMSFPLQQLSTVK